MGTLYEDLFTRDNFNDDGTVPVPNSYVSASPDIIPYGTDTLTQQQLIDHYGPPLLHKDLQNNQVNNIYVRAKNNYNGSTSGQIYLYYAPANLLVNVSVWRSNRIHNANGTWGANVSAQQLAQICPGDQGFQFNPPTSLGRHFCLLSQTCTQMHPNPLPATDFTGWQGFVDWVRNNANVSWHNVNICNTLPPQGFITNLVFQNLNPTTEFYGFGARYQNMPKGSTLRVWADAAGGFQGFDVQREINDVNGQLGAGQYFPPQFQTTINCTCHFPGSPVTPPPDVIISLESMGSVAEAQAPENAKYQAFMFHPSKLGISHEEHGLPAGSAFVPITSYSVAFNPTSNAALFAPVKR